MNFLITSRVMTTHILNSRTQRFGKNLIDSFYAERSGDKFCRIFKPENSLPAFVEKAYEDFRLHVLGVDFPCVGAKAALTGNFYRAGFYHEMNAPETTRVLAG